MRKFISGVLVGTASTAFGIWFLGRKQLAEGERNRDPFKDGYTVIVGTREEATNIMLELESEIREHGCVSVSDLNQLIDQKSDFQDTKTGWTSTDGTVAGRGYPGYVITLPPPVVL